MFVARWGELLRIILQFSGSRISKIVVGAPPAILIAKYRRLPGRALRLPRWGELLRIILQFSGIRISKIVVGVRL